MKHWKRIVSWTATVLTVGAVSAGAAGGAEEVKPAVASSPPCGIRYDLVLDKGIFVPRDAKGKISTQTSSATWKAEPLTLHMYVAAGGRITAGWGQVEGYLNPIAFDVSRLEGTSTGVTGRVVGMRFEDTAPVISERITIKATIANGKITGTFTGESFRFWGSYSVTGGTKDKKPLPVKGSIQGTTVSMTDLQAQFAFNPKAAWPAWRGPNGNGVATPFDGKTVDSKEEIRLLWNSEGWIPRDTNDHAYGRDNKLSTSFTGPVVADGKVFCCIQLPNPDGPLDQKVESELKPEEIKVKGSFIDRSLLYHHALLVDDVIYGIEGSTGRTLWKTVFPMAGMRWGQMHLTPLAHGDKVYVTTAQARIVCLNAQTGALEWQQPLIPAWFEAFERMKKEMAGKPFVKGTDVGQVQINMALAGGVLVCNTGGNHRPWEKSLPGFLDRADALFGLDPATGAILWGPVKGCIARHTSPIRWTWKEQEYILTGQACLDPKTGKVLWNEGMRAGDILAPVLCGPSADGTAEVMGMGPLGFLLTPTGRKPHWKIEGVYGSDCTVGAILHGFYIYFGMNNVVIRTKGEKEYYGRGWNVIAPKTGALISSTQAYAGHEGAYADLQVANDLLIQPGKSYGGTLWKLSTDGKTITQVADLSDTGTGAATPNAVADGRVFVRGDNGLVCYDIRKPTERNP